MPKRGDFLLTVDKLVNTSIGGDLKLFFGKDENLNCNKILISYHLVLRICSTYSEQRLRINESILVKL